MNNTTITQNGVTLQLNELVSAAAMALPPIDSPEKKQFLQRAINQVRGSALQNFVSLSPAAAQAEFDTAAEALEKEDDVAPMQDWLRRHLDEAQDGQAAAIMQRVLEDIELALPQALRNAYEEEFPSTPTTLAA